MVAKAKVVDGAFSGPRECGRQVFFCIYCDKGNSYLYLYFYLDQVRMAGNVFVFAKLFGDTSGTTLVRRRAFIFGFFTDCILVKFEHFTFIEYFTLYSFED